MMDFKLKSFKCEEIDGLVDIELLSHSLPQLNF